MSTEPVSYTHLVTKSDAETGTAQGGASLAGAVYGIYKGEELIDTYTCLLYTSRCV